MDHQRNFMVNRIKQVVAGNLPIFVRRAATGDAALLSYLNEDVHAVHAQGMPEHFKPTNPETFPAYQVSDLLAKPETLMLLAHAADDPAGYIYAEVIRRPENAIRQVVSMLYIHHISVRPHLRGAGVGKALLAAARTAAHDQGITRLGLDVWRFNDAARSFFHSQGFVVVRETLHRAVEDTGV